MRFAQVVVGVEKAEGFPSFLPPLKAISYPWHGSDGLGGTASWGFGVVVRLDIVADVSCHLWCRLRWWCGV